MPQKKRQPQGGGASGGGNHDLYLTPPPTAHPIVSLAPRVECAYDEMVPLEKLIPNPRNPNKHPSEQVVLIAKIIKGQGWRLPITVSRRSGFIVRGHGRLAAAELLGLKEAPVDFQEYASEAEEWADLIADNRLSELSTFDPASLKELLEELDTGALDMDMTGFDTAALEELMTQAAVWTPDKDLPEGDGELTGRLIVVYDTAEEKAQVCRALGVDGKKIIYTFKDLALKMAGDGTTI